MSNPYSAPKVITTAGGHLLTMAKSFTYIKSAMKSAKKSRYHGKAYLGNGYIAMCGTSDADKSNMSFAAFGLLGLLIYSLMKKKDIIKFSYEDYPKELSDQMIHDKVKPIFVYIHKHDDTDSVAYTRMSGLSIRSKNGDVMKISAGFFGNPRMNREYQELTGGKQASTAHGVDAV